MRVGGPFSSSKPGIRISKLDVHEHSWWTFGISQFKLPSMESTVYNLCIFCFLFGAGLEDTANLKATKATQHTMNVQWTEEQMLSQMSTKEYRLTPQDRLEDETRTGRQELKSRSMETGRKSTDGSSITEIEFYNHYKSKPRLLQGNYGTRSSPL